MLNIQTLQTFDTVYSADSVEWCPYPSYTKYFVCGTYQLEEKKDEHITDVAPNSSTTTPSTCRKGRLYLFKFDVATTELNELHRLETAAILDMKWMPPSSSEISLLPILATSNALGEIELYVLKGYKLLRHATLALNADCENLLALSLDWQAPHLTVDSATQRQILASDSKGDIALITCNILADPLTLTLTKQHAWNAHKFEAWICCFDKWQKNHLYTGGDDCFLRVYDARTNDPVICNKTHTAGVTCLLSHPQYEHLLLSGSYDERMRIFDTRAIKQPLTELNLDGGIWRLKADPFGRDWILAACMYHNFSIVEMNAAGLKASSGGDDDVNLALKGTYDEHQSICYGADWCYEGSDEASKGLSKTLYMATCSFYDHKLSIARIDTDDEIVKK